METTVMTELIKLLGIFLTSIITSSGFWVYFNKRQEKNDLSKKLLIGLAHDRIVFLSIKYIERGSITHDEYENLCQFLYTPYTEMGGNGSVTRLMAEVDKLPIDNTLPIPKPKRRRKKDVSE